MTQDNQGKKKIGFIEIGTFIIAILAFGLSFWQMNQTREHNKLTLKPKISVWVTADDEKEIIDISIENNGVGPAVLGVISAEFEDEVVKVNGYKLQQFWMHTFELLNIPDTTKSNIYRDIIDEEFYLKEGNSITLFKYPIESSKKSEYLKIKKELQNMRLVIPYCSVYEDCEIISISPKEFYFTE